ncbi:MAG: glycosyltransferase family 4 protein [Desulfovibrionaceae bacterium]|nr:glycosyltransferase family 4 protein [Desulfovibrionaceae bacterium]
MRLVYFISSFSLSGGTLVLMQHVRALNEMGHEAVLAFLKQDDSYEIDVPAQKLESVSAVRDLQPDVVVACHYPDLPRLRPHVPLLVFLVQSRHVEEMGYYYEAERSRAKYAWPLGRLVLGMRQSRDMAALKKAYSLPDVFWSVSWNIEASLKSMGHASRMVRNVLNLPPRQGESAPPIPPCRIVMVGSHAVPFKNIRLGLEALKLLRQRTPVFITHVSTGEPLPADLAAYVDESLHCLPHDALIRLCRTSHILFSPSLMEGFGLPAVEGMACGMLCVLSDIPEYHMFHRGAGGKQGLYALYGNPRDAEDMARVLEMACREYASPVMESIRQNGVEVAAWYAEDGFKADLAAALEELPASK